MATTKNPTDMTTEATHTVPCMGGYRGCAGETQAPLHIAAGRCDSCADTQDRMTAERKAAGARGAAAQARNAARFDTFIARHDA